MAKQRKDRSSREEQFLDAWKEHSPFGPEGMPEREYRFHPERGWRFDFAWPSLKVAVEIQGLGGGHQSISGLRRDAEKFRAGLLDGWVIIPMTSPCLGSKAKLEDAVHYVAEILRLRHERSRR
jgi:hypothetical protein